MRQIREIWVSTKSRKHKEIREMAIWKMKTCYGVDVDPDCINTGFKHNDNWHHQVWFPTVTVNPQHHIVH